MAKNYPHPPKKNTGRFSNLCCAYLVIPFNGGIQIFHFCKMFLIYLLDYFLLAIFSYFCFLNFCYSDIGPPDGL